MPLVEEETDADKRRRDDGGEKLRHSVRKELLHHTIIIHNIGCKVGEISLTEERQRQLTQLFGERDTSVAALGIDIGKGALVLQQRHDVGNRKESYGYNRIVPDTVHHGILRVDDGLQIVRQKHKQKYHR